MSTKFKSNIAGGSTDAILASMFKGMLNTLGVDPMRLDSLVNRFINVHLSVEDRAKLGIRSGIIKDLLEDSITWKTFLIGLKILRTKEVTIHLRLTHYNRMRTEHSYTFDISEANDPVNYGIVLSGFYKEIVEYLGFTEAKANNLLKAYIVKNSLLVGSKTESSIRGSIKKELSTNKMTWRVFIKGLIVLGVINMDLGFTLRHMDDTFSEHKRSIKFS